MKRPLLVVLICALAAGCSSTDTTRSAPTTPSIAVPSSTVSVGEQARLECEKQVRGQLVTPTAARFTGETTTDKGDNTWEVAGTVNGQRKQDETAADLSWTCTAIYNPSTGGFKLDGEVTGIPARSDRLPSVAAMCADLKQVFTFGGGNDAADQFYATVQSSNSPALGTGLRWSDLTDNERDNLRLAIYQAANNNC